MDLSLLEAIQISDSNIMWIGITTVLLFILPLIYVILKYLVKKENTPDNAVMYGIGHGGIEVWSISLAAMV